MDFKYEIYNKVRKYHLEHWKVIALYLVAYDSLVVNMAYFLALWLRFDCKFNTIPKGYMIPFLYFVPGYTLFCVLLFRRLKLYHSIWRFASFSELIRVTVATGVTSTFNIVGMTLLCRIINSPSIERMPISYHFFGMLIQFFLVLGIRFSYRFILLQRRVSEKNTEPEKQGNVMLIGAGSAGQMILRDINGGKRTNDRIVCIIDDNSNKWNRYIDGIQIVGGRDSIMQNVEKYGIEKIFVAIPGAKPKQRRDILNICKETGCELKNLPAIHQFITGEVSVNAMREVAIEDLLGRAPIKVDMKEIFKYIRGKTILVTGGGGSIGSELCRQIAAHGPKQLIIFDIYENNAYDIQLELKKKHPELDLVTLIGSVRDSRRIAQVFETYRPNIVYHAAAHKHVPLMEDSPCEAIKNNTAGTYKTAYAAMLYGSEKFVLISSDKAVNPTNIMGASKRLCEMIIQSFDKKVKEGKMEEIPLLFCHNEDEFGGLPIVKEQLRMAKTEFVAVRFGNVLGSNGSVIPLFKKQILNGGPVTVTHPDIIRYFMTIPEAVTLVLQAGTYAKGGNIFILDMGEAVKIDALARNLILLSGYKPDVDIKIEYVGLRPGEKLYEEKLMAEEGMCTTPNKLIHIGSPVNFNIENFLMQLEVLLEASYEGREDIRDLVGEMIIKHDEIHRETIDEMRECI